MHWQRAHNLELFPKTGLSRRDAGMDAGFGSECGVGYVCFQSTSTPCFNGGQEVIARSASALVGYINSAHPSTD